MKYRRLCAEECVLENKQTIIEQCTQMYTNN